jgi:hypothetical protein
LDVRTFDDMQRAGAALAGQVLFRPGGLFVSFMPNGKEAHRAVSAWGEAHPQFIDDVFLDYSLTPGRKPDAAPEGMHR